MSQRAIAPLPSVGTFKNLRVPTSFVFEFLLLLFGERDGQLFQRGHLIVDVLIDDSSHPQTPPFILPQKFFLFFGPSRGEKRCTGMESEDGTTFINLAEEIALCLFLLFFQRWIGFGDSKFTSAPFIIFTGTRTTEN